MPTEYDWRNGQDRTRWLHDMLDAYVADPLNHYLGPTGIPERAQTLGQALEYTDAGDYLEATNAGRALWDEPSVGNALRAAGAVGAAAIPVVSAKMVNDGVDVAGDAWRSLQDDWGKFWADEDGALALGREPATPAQEVARLLREGGEVTDEIYGRLGPADHMELTALYDDPSAPTGMYLPQDEASRMARAREMGFDVEYPPMYRGDAIDPPAAFTDESPVYLTEHPSHAMSYAVDGESTGPITPIYTRIESTAPPEVASEIGGIVDPGLNADFSWQYLTDGHTDRAGEVADTLRDMGFDAVRHDDDFVMSGAEQIDSLGVLRPEMLRSRFAHFDPRLRHLRNLSAALAPVAMLNAYEGDEPSLIEYLNQ